jgi:hypothetical protein
MTTAADLVDVIVEAPDGAAALELEHRLARLGPATIAENDGWRVTVHDADLEAVEREVMRWLRLIGTESTVVQAGTREFHVSRPSRMHVPSHGDFIG